MKTLLAPLILLLACAGAQAQPIYRCGADGRTYSQTPCEQGRRLDLADDRSAAQQQEAQAVAENARTLADALERNRLDREADVRPAMAGTLGSRTKAAPVDSPRSKTQATGKKRHKARRATKDEDFRAVAPARARS